MSLCFTPDELREITGYRQKKKVLAACHAFGIPVITVGPDGRPRVMRNFNAPHGKVTSKALTKSEPNTAALKEMQNGQRTKKS